LSNATLWPFLWLIVSFLTTPSGYVPLAIIACVIIRTGLAQDLQRRLTPERHLVSPGWLVPVKDLLNVAIWLGAFAGDTVEWRGRRMTLLRDGTLLADSVTP
jgi:ceramide glucosyltransferase